MAYSHICRRPHPSGVAAIVVVVTSQISPVFSPHGSRLLLGQSASGLARHHAPFGSCQISVASGLRGSGSSGASAATMPVTCWRFFSSSGMQPARIASVRASFAAFVRQSGASTNTMRSQSHSSATACAADSEIGTGGAVFIRREVRVQPRVRPPCVTGRPLDQDSRHARRQRRLGCRVGVVGGGGDVGVDRHL